MKKFHANHFVKGKINSKLNMYVENGTVTFEKGLNENTCIVVVDESKITSKLHEKILIDLVGKHKEIRE
jgi:predicted acetyltransferase